MKLTGQCHCGAVHVSAEFSTDFSTLSPRECDCSFCTRHGAAYLSDANGSLEFRAGQGGSLNKYRQGPTGKADFLLCSKCGVLMGVMYSEDGRDVGALNATIFPKGTFTEKTGISPQQLPQADRIERWKKLWFQRVSIVSESLRPKAVAPIAMKDVPPRTKQSNYPEPYRSMMNGRIKSQLGEFFGLKNFGVNMTKLLPGGQSSLLHRHSRQDEFILILEGRPTLVTGEGEFQLEPGMCAGFPAGGSAHQLVNRTQVDVYYVEAGDRTAGDEATYPRDDIQARMGPDGSWIFTKKDGSAF